MQYTCENCNHVFPIKRHEKAYIDHKIVLVMGTGLNMVYCGHMNREYALCPSCLALEDQWSAEARDQSQDPEDKP